MPVTVVVGTQWGDEGKAKVIDLLAASHSIVARYQGGHNAGHTVVIGDQKYALQLTPSGVFYGSVTPVIGNGVVVDLPTLFREIDSLESRGISTSQLKVSSLAHLIFPWHQAIDAALEAARGDARIGTTLKGIGPAYVDKVKRAGIRAGEVLNIEEFEAKVRDRAVAARREVSDIGGDTFDVESVVSEFVAYGQRLAPYVADTVNLLHDARERGEHILLEGAQATFLDVDHGTYPFVTSSNCVAGNAAAGAGVGPQLLHYVLGITKAYCTRVGGGPFPTELDWEKEGTPGWHMSTVGAEKGVTTGRSRRCGWFDAALLKRSAQVNGLSGLCITKLDVLDGLPELKLCTGYKLDGEVIDILPMGADDIARCEPIYETLPGWTESSVGVTRYDDLPVNARLYLERIQATTGVPIHVVSTSPDRDHTILLHHPYHG